MNELISINYHDDQPMVSARDLYEGIGVKSKFIDWFNNILEFGFEEGKDFNLLKIKKVQQEGNRLVNREMLDYEITIDMAKQICMTLRTEKGRIYRQYFIDLEKAWNSPKHVMARALQMANQTAEEFQRECKILQFQLVEQNKLIEAMAPKARYLDEILQSDSLFLTTQIAKDYGMSARKLNGILRDLGIQYKANEQWVLYAKYQGQDYAHSTTFVIKGSSGDRVKMQTEWTPKGRKFLYEVLKAEGFLPVVEKGGEAIAGRNH